MRPRRSRGPSLIGLLLPSACGGGEAMERWEGSQLDSYAKEPDCGTVEECDAVEHVLLSFLPVPVIQWTNRPTFQQVIQIREAR